MKILALDVATYCGWAHSSGGRGVWDMSVKRDESSGMRLIRLRMNLNSMLEQHGIELVVYEAVRTGFGRRSAMIVQSEIQGVLKSWCEENGIPYKGYSSNTIKQHATGDGRASKEKMVDAFERKNGFPVEDSQHDMVDAWWLLDMVKKELSVA